MADTINTMTKLKAIVKDKYADKLKDPTKNELPQSKSRFSKLRKKFRKSLKIE